MCLQRLSTWMLRGSATRGGVIMLILSILGVSVYGYFAIKTTISFLMFATNTKIEVASPETSSFPSIQLCVERREQEKKAIAEWFSATTAVSEVVTSCSLRNNNSKSLVR
jgi:hypothetical protein